MISAALIADGAIGNIQEKIFSDFQPSEDELVFFSHLIGGIIILFISIIMGEFISAVAFTIKHIEILVWLLGSILLAYAGLHFVLGLIKIFGSYVAMTVTSCRKVVSIVLSFILFPKQLTSYFLLSSILIFTGLFVHICAKNTQKINELLFSKKYSIDLNQHSRIGLDQI